MSSNPAVGLAMMAASMFGARTKVEGGEGGEGESPAASSTTEAGGVHANHREYLLIYPRIFVNFPLVYGAPLQGLSVLLLGQLLCLLFTFSPPLFSPHTHLLSLDC